MKNVVGKIGGFIEAGWFIINAYFWVSIFNVVMMIDKEKAFIPNDGAFPEFIELIQNKEYLSEYVGKSVKVSGRRMTKAKIQSLRSYVMALQKAFMMGKLWQERFDEVYINLNEAERSLL